MRPVITCPRTPSLISPALAEALSGRDDTPRGASKRPWQCQKKRKKKTATRHMQGQTEPVHVSVGLSCDAQGRQSLTDAPPVLTQAARSCPQPSDRRTQPMGMPPCSHFRSTNVTLPFFFFKQHHCITCSTDAQVALGWPSGGLHNACCNMLGHLPVARLQHVERLAGSTAAE